MTPSRARESIKSRIGNLDRPSSSQGMREYRALLASKAR
jgi:hypothetical protein